MPESLPSFSHYSGRREAARKARVLAMVRLLREGWLSFRVFPSQVFCAFSAFQRCCLCTYRGEKLFSKSGVSKLGVRAVQGAPWNEKCFCVGPKPSKSSDLWCLHLCFSQSI